MRYGIVIPSGDIHTILDLTVEAEAAGWDGVFTWDAIYIGPEHVGVETRVYDPWVLLAAMAVRTERVRLGAMLTPPSRRRPWKLARETVTVDHLSNGRLVLPVGLGAVDTFGLVGEQTDRRVRAELLDESLNILTGLWSGRPFQHQGKHYQLGEMTFVPTPVQQPRIPIWVVGSWPRERSMARALRYDGLLASVYGTTDLAPDDVRAMRAYATEQRPASAPYDIIVEGITPTGDPARAADQVRPFAAAGATWWIESPWTPPNGPAEVRARIRQGPPGE